MKFIPIDRNSIKTQEFLILDEMEYDIKGKLDMTLISVKTEITSIIIEFFNESANTQQLESAYICNQVIKNNLTFCVILINILKNQPQPKHKTVAIKPTGMQLNSGDMIYFLIHKYDNPLEEITDCSKIDLFAMTPTPTHKNGNIIIGTP